MSNFLAEAKEIQSDLATLRRRLHQEPEIGLDLPKTQAKIVAALDGLGLEVTTGKALSSLFSQISMGDCPFSGPWLVIRHLFNSLRSKG